MNAAGNSGLLPFKGYTSIELIGSKKHLLIVSCKKHNKNFLFAKKHVKNLTFQSLSQFFNRTILLLSSNPKGLNLVFRVASSANILNQLIHTSDVFSWLKIIFSSVNFFLLLGLMHYWQRGNCCGEIAQNGVLELTFLLKKRMIFALVYH